jgi:ribonuclease E
VPEEKLAEKSTEKVVENPALEAPLVVHLTETEEENTAREGSRRRGRRGGRRERERRDGNVTETSSSNSDEPIVVQVGTTKRKPSEYLALPTSMREAAALAAQQAAEQAAAPVVVVEAMPVETVASEVVVPTETSGNAVASVVNATPVAEVNALIQIETDSNKVTPLPSDQHIQAASTRRRARQREVYVENEPLVQIETQH